MPNASYFLGSRLLAVSPLPILWDDLSRADNSLVFVCPTCGDAWGRIAEEGKPWLPVRRGCRKHPWCDEVGGSFIAPWRKAYNELPPEVLLYEIEIRLNLSKEPSP